MGGRWSSGRAAAKRAAPRARRSARWRRRPPPPPWRPSRIGGRPISTGFSGGKCGAEVGQGFGGIVEDAGQKHTQTLSSFHTHLANAPPPPPSPQNWPTCGPSLRRTRSGSPPCARRGGFGPRESEKRASGWGARCPRPSFLLPRYAALLSTVQCASLTCLTCGGGGRAPGAPAALATPARGDSLLSSVVVVLVQRRKCCRVRGWRAAEEAQGAAPPLTPPSSRLGSPQLGHQQPLGRLHARVVAQGATQRVVGARESRGERGRQRAPPPPRRAPRGGRDAHAVDGVVVGRQVAGDGEEEGRAVGWE